MKNPVHAALAALVALPAAGLLIAAGPTASFKPVDSNGDGKITREEFQNARVQQIMSADADNDGKVSAAELAEVGEDSQDAARPHFNTDRIVRLIDADKDGQLSKTEVEKAVAGRFAMLDANADGVIDQNERKNWRLPAPN